MHALSSGLRCNGGPMSKNNLTEAGATEPANKERKAARRTVQLKSSAWYQAAVRSIGITKESLHASRNDDLEYQAATSASRHQRSSGDVRIRSALPPIGTNSRT
jgi:hypothetical protein